ETAFNDLLADQPALTNILLYHVIGEALTASEVVGQDGEFVETLYTGFDVVIRVIDGEVFINDSKVITTDIITSNGIIHVIDTVLQPVDQTIADVVIENASADDPEFVTLLFAVQAANPLVLDTLSDPDQDLTVFAPTDAAFEALKAELGEDAFNALVADQEALTSILLYHVLGESLIANEVVARNGEFIETLYATYDVAVQLKDGEVFINDSKVVTTDIITSNGIIHVIDAVLVPEERTIADIVVENATADDPEFTTLLAAVQAADPLVLDALSDPEADLTVFAPTDEAFGNLISALGITPEELLATEDLTDILLYHVIPGKNLAAKVIQFETVVTLQGEEIKVTVTNEGVFLNDTIKIIVTDIVARNGVIHVIDGVLIPPSGVEVCEFRPRRDLRGVVLDYDWSLDYNGTARAEITNRSTACTYQVGFASYKKFDDIIDNQELFDWTDATTGIQPTIAPGETIELTVALPDCATQIDVFYGEVLFSLDGQRYDRRRLDSRNIGGDNFCQPFQLVSTVTITKEWVDAEGTPTDPPADLSNFSITATSDLETVVCAAGEPCSLQVEQGQPYSVSETPIEGWQPIQGIGGGFSCDSPACDHVVINQKISQPDEPDDEPIISTITITKEWVDAEGTPTDPPADLSNFSITATSDLETVVCAAGEPCSLQVEQGQPYSVSETPIEGWQPIQGIGEGFTCDAEACDHVVINQQEPPEVVCEPDARADLQGSIEPGAEAGIWVGTVTNTSADCSYEVALAAYGKYGSGDLAEQQLFSSQPSIEGLGDPNSATGVVVGPGETVTLSVNGPTLPDSDVLCATQVDLAFDAIHLNAYNGYDGEERLVELQKAPIVLPGFYTGLYGRFGDIYGDRLIVAVTNNYDGLLCDHELPNDEPAEDPGDDTPADDQPEDEQPADDQPADDTEDHDPGDDTPADDQPEDEQPADDQPADDTEDHDPGDDVE
ncbi:MAG: hypothetical protein GYB66_02825, partial [Chloroflexi bacterium]|nr:hypothetical protein [Chloroflexota bacterium]